ncbi:thymidylate kinase [Streptomyces gramineus]|uniref:thymidylate kinase n=1 Tax=Streptomyces gramineus TaxID=910542 RepID=UPI00398B51E1
MIVSLVGTDGAGKSTVSRLAAARLSAAGRRTERVDRWDIVGNPAYPTTRFMAADVTDTRRCAAEMPNTARFLFLMWSMAHALLGRTPPAVGPDLVTLLDGYWTKHAASEIVYGLDSAWVEGVVSGLPRPEQVVYLRLEPEQAWERKAGDVIPYECGMDPRCTRDSFLGHQGRVLEVLDGWAERFDWLTLDAGRGLDEVLGAVVTALGDTASRPHSDGVRVPPLP